MKYDANEVAEKTQTSIVLILFLLFIALMSWMQEDDRQSLLREACAQTPQMEVCSTLTKEK